MPTATTIDPTRFLGDLGKALIQLGDDPGAVEELRSAFDRDDHSSFGAILERLGIQPPGDLCYPYVTVLITTVTSYQLVERCTWELRPQLPKPARPKGEGGEPVDETVDEPVDPPLDLLDPPDPADLPSLKEWLEKNRVLVCRWHLEATVETKKLEKFIQGMCPDGTF